jgi:hypothetical protein
MIEHKWGQPEVEKLRQLRREGKSYQECADYFGVSRNAIAGVVNRYITFSGRRRYAWDPEVPVYRPGHPKRWDETLLTEPYAERKARLKAEREARCD